MPDFSVLGWRSWRPAWAPATLLVTNLADAGPGSLRQAIMDSNASVGVHDTIQFNVSGTIGLLSARVGLGTKLAVSLLFAALGIAAW